MFIVIVPNITDVLIRKSSFNNVVWDCFGVIVVLFFGLFPGHVAIVWGSVWECFGVIWGVFGGKIRGKPKTKTEKK